MVAFGNKGGPLAPPGAVQPHFRNIHLSLRQQGADFGHHAGHVGVADNQGGVVAAYVGLQSVNLCNIDDGAAQGLADQIQHLAAFAHQVQLHGVGVGVLQLGLLQPKGHAPGLGNGKSPGDPGVIRVHTAQPGDQCQGRAMAAAGEPKGAVQSQGGVLNRLPQQLAGNVADTHCTGGVRAGRPHHHRA